MTKQLHKHAGKLGIALASAVAAAPVQAIAQTAAAEENQETSKDVLSQKVTTNSTTYNADGTPTSKTDYEYDANGKTIRTTISTYDTENGEWEFISQTLYKYDESGNTISQTDQTWTGDEWKTTGIVELTYDSEGRMTSSKTTTLHETSGEMIVSEETAYTYDEEGKRTNRLIVRRRIYASEVYEYLCDEQGTEAERNTKVYSSETGWTTSSSTKYQNEYDAEGRLTSQTTLSLQGKEYVASYRHDYTYDEKGNQTSRTYSTVNSETGELEVSNRYDFTYDENGKQTSYSYSTADSETGELEVINRYDFTYDENGKQTSYSYSTADSETGKLEVSYRYDYTYDEKGNQTSSTYLRANSETGELEVCGHHDYAYDENGNQTSSTYLRANSETGELEVSERHDYAYDGNGNQTSHTYSSVNSETGELEISERQSYTYDENGSQTSSEVETKGGKAEWTEGTSNIKYDYVYDEAGNILCKTTIKVDAQGVETPTAKEETTYDALGHATEVITYNYDGSTWVPQSKKVYGPSIEGYNNAYVSYRWDGADWKRNGYSFGNFYRLQTDESGKVTGYEIYNWNYATEDFSILRGKYSVKLDSENRVTEVAQWYDNYAGWITTAKYTYADNGDRTKRFSAEVSYDRKHEHTYDEQGNQTLEEHYSWDSENSQWVLSSKIMSEYEFDANGNKTKQTNYTWHEASQVWIASSIYTFDANGNSTMRFDANIYSDSKYEHTYDEQGNETLFENYSWDSENSQWVLSSKIMSEYEYDANGKKTKQTEYTWHETSQAWIVSNIYTFDAKGNSTTRFTANIYSDSKREYTYDEHGNQTLVENFTWDSENNQWILTPISYKEYKYNANGTMAQRTNYTWHEASQTWFASSIITYDANGNSTTRFSADFYSDTRYESTFDEHGNLKLFESYTWDSKNSQWVRLPISDTYYEYDANDNKTKQTNYTWHEASQTWIASSIITYDAKGNSTTRFTAFVRSDGSRVEYTYDEQGNQTLVENYTWDSENSQWVLSSKSKTEYEYDEQGNKTLVENYTWDSENSQWVLSSKSKAEYEYDANGNKTKQTSYTWHETSQAWIVSSIYEYDAKGSSSLRFRASTDSNSKREYSYDEHGNQTHYEVYSWDSENSQWVLSSKNKTEYEYDFDGNTTGYVQYHTSDTENETWEYSYGSGYKFVEETQADGSVVLMSYGFNSETKAYDIPQNDRSILKYEGDLLVKEDQTYIESESAWQTTGKSEYELDANGNKTKQTSYTWHETSQAWIVSNIYTFDAKGKSTMRFSAEVYSESKYEYSYDEQGNQSLYERYSWDSDNSQWVLSPISKSDYEYDANGNKTKQTDYIWHETSQAWIVSNIYTFDAKGNSTTLFNANIYSDSRREYTYDEQGNQTLYERYSWDSDNSQWVLSPISKTDFEYDANDKMTKRTDYTWHEASQAWIVSRIYTYDAKGNSTTRFSADVYSGNKYESTYDEQGNKTLEEYYFWDSENSQWVLSSKIMSKYEFDANGNKTKQTEYTWHEASQTWIVSRIKEFDAKGNSTLRFSTLWSDGSKEEYTYDEHSNRTLYEVYSWDSENSQWVLSSKSKTEYEYDANGNMTKQTEYTWHEASQAWYVNSIKEFDANGNSTMRFSASIYSDSRREYTYDEQGNQTLEEHYSWDSENSQWVLSSKTKTDYEHDANGKMTKRTEYTWHEASQAWIVSSIEEFDTTGNSTTRFSAKVQSGSKDECSYDEKENLTLEEHYTWDSTAKSWQLQTQTKSSYDERSHLVSSETYTYSATKDKMVQTGGSRVTTTYDEHGNVISQKTDTYAYPNQLVGSSKTETSYTANGKVDKSTYYSWDIEDGYLVTSSTAYTYDADGNTLRIDNYRNVAGEIQQDTYTVNTVMTLEEALNANALPLVQEDGDAKVDNRIFDLGGRYVGTSTERLQPGLYIRGGRLFHVR